MPHTTEHDRLRGEALWALRKAQLALRKLSTDGTDVEPARAAVREASELVGRIRRSVPGIRSIDSDAGRFTPLAADHPAVGRLCPGCGEPLQPGEEICFVNATPTDDEHIAEVQLAHEACVNRDQEATT